MNVKLVSVTSSRIESLQDISPEQIIIYIARVSSGRKDLIEDYPRLIKYLIKNKHWSPFEMASMCVEIETSRAIAQQILRHRSFTFQEFSQRYAIAQDMEDVELRMQAEKNRQSSTDAFDPEISVHMPNNDKIIGRASDLVGDHLTVSQRLYAALIEEGVAKETARFVLPLTTQTRLYMNGTVRSWIHYLQIRDDGHVQREHRLIAKEIKQIFVRQFPVTSTALGWTELQEPEPINPALMK
jgi:thymidylate synthase (FAD)